MNDYQDYAWSGLPDEAWASYDLLAGFVLAVAIASAIAGAVAVMWPTGARRRFHACVVLAAAVMTVAWATYAALGSTAPRGGMSCASPASWTGGSPTTCVANAPVWLLASPLGFAVAVAGLGLALAFARSRDGALPEASKRRSSMREVVLAYTRGRAKAIGIAIASIAMMIAMMRSPGFVQPTVFEEGGIIPMPEAFLRMCADPTRALIGLAFGAVLVLIPRARRAIP